MVISCSVSQCNSSLKTKKEFKFHSYPKDEKTKKLWLVAVRSGKKPTIHSKVCSKHFKDSDYVESFSGLSKVLKKGSIPSQNLPKRSHEKCTKTRKMNRKQQIEHETVGVADIKVKDTYISNQEGNANGKNCQILPINSAIMDPTKKKIRLKCYIPGCKTVFGEDKNIICHRIRKSVISSKKERQKWRTELPFLTEEDFSKRKYLICSLHYRDQDYIYRPLKHFKREKGLKPFAMPSLNLPATDDSLLTVKTKIRRRRKKNELLNQPVIDLSESRESSPNKATRTSKRLDPQKVIEIPNDSPEEDSNDVIKCKCMEKVETKNIGIQCDITIGSFLGCDLNNFFDENVKFLENRTNKPNSRAKNIQTSSEHNETNYEEFLAEISNGRIVGIEKRKRKFSTDQTCDLPSDSEFFDELAESPKVKLVNIKGTHCCSECGLLFSDLKTYRDHEGVHQEISLLCMFCGKISKEYMQHVEHEFKCLKSQTNEDTPSKTQKKRQYSKLAVEDNNSLILKDYTTESKDKENSLNKLISSKATVDEVEFLCEFCQQSFEQEKMYQNHLKEHKKANSPNTLRSSPIQLSSDTTLEFLSKTQIGEYSCQFCDKSYATEYLLTRHREVQHINPIRRTPLFQCTDCAMTFRNGTKFQAHVREHVATHKHCKICNIVFLDNTKYLNHLQTPIHLTLEKKWKDRYKIGLFACSLCKTKDTEFDMLSDLAAHSKFHRISKTKTFINSILSECELQVKLSIIN